MRPVVRVLPADRPHHLRLRDRVALPHRGGGELHVQRVVAVAVRDDHREPVGADPLDQRHGAALHRAHRRPRRRRDPDPVVPDHAPARQGLAAELEDDAPVHRPFEAAEAGRGDRGALRGGGGRRGVRPAGGGPCRVLAAGPLQGGEEVVQAGRIALQLHQAPLVSARGALQRGEPPGPLVLELVHPRQLLLAVRPREVELLLDADDVGPLLGHAVAQPLDVAHQGAVLPAGQVQVLVAAEQVAERLRGEQHLEGVERSPLVDVHQPPLEHRAPLRQVVLGEHQLGAGAAELVGEPADLPLDLVHDPVGGGTLALEVVELVGDVVHLALQPLLLPGEPLALRLDLLQAPPALLQLPRGVLGERGPRRGDHAERQRQQQPAHPRPPGGRSARRWCAGAVPR